MSQRSWLLSLVVFCVFAGPAFGQTVTIEWVDDSGQPLSQAYEFSMNHLRVTDSGSAGLGNLSARVTSDLRGDEEWVYLWEDGNNPGVFAGSIYVPGTLATDPPSPDGFLEVTEQAGPPHQRDTIRAFLEGCSVPPCPSDAVGMIGSTIRLTDSERVDVDHAVPGTPLYIAVRDHGAPYWAPTTATIVSQSGDSETVSLPPDFSDPETPIHVFRQSIDVEIGPAVPGDGVLQVQDPDTLTASHPDPLGLSSSTDSAAVALTQIEFLDRAGTAVDALMVGGDIRVRAVNPDGNLNPGATDTVTAAVRSWQATGSVYDTESLQLSESGPNTAVFTGTLPSQAHYWVTAGDGVLQVYRTNDQNDTVEVTLGATTASATLIPGVIRVIDASGADVTNIPEGGTVHLRVEYEDGNDPTYQGSFFVRVLSLTTGDQQYVMVWETGMDTGVFEGSLPTVLATSPIPFNEQLETQSGETIRASLDHFFGSAVDLAVIGEGTPSSNPPNAVDDAATTADDVAVSINVLANDNDPDGHAFQLWSFTQGAQGGTVGYDNGLLVYTPPPYFTGIDTFTYIVRDLAGDQDSATVTVTVQFINDPPSANADAFTTNEDQSVVITPAGNDHDPENQALRIIAVTQGVKGTVAIQDADLGYVSYTPQPNAFGSDSFTYTIRDPQGATGTATVSVTINPLQDPPVAANDSATTAEDTATTVNVLANDSDIDGDSLSVTAVTQGTNGSVTFGAASATYTPNANFNGSDSFTYSIGDGNGGTATATVSVNVTVVNDNPTAGNDSAGTDEDATVAINVLTNDSDLDGDTLSITAVTQGIKGSVTFTAGSVAYTPAANANESDSFTYTVSDGNGGTATATVAITITAVNDAPDAVNDAAGTNEDAAVTISVLANDADVDGEAVVLTVVTQGTRGSVAQNGNGTVTYTPNPNSFGADAFTYTVRDAAGLTDTATVAVNVAPINDPPDAIDDSATTNEGGNVAIAVLANDTDLEGDALSITSVSTPAHGTATINGNTITYTPSPTYSGTDSFTYTMSDGPATDNATVTIQIKDVLGNVAVLGTHSVWLQSGADVLSGDVIANDAGSAPFLSSTEVSIASSATTAAGWDVQGHRVTIASGATVASDVYSNQLANSGSVSGAQYTPLSLPVFATLPAFQSASPGSTDINVASNGTRTLAPGSYRDLIVGRRATVTFTGGVYHFRSIRTDREAKLFFSGGSEVRVQQRVSTNTLTVIGPSSGSVTAASIVFHVAGVNGTSGGLSATPKAVEIGTDNTVSANLYAPNGTLWLKDRTQATGAFLGLDVQIGVDGQVSLTSAW
jgi:hypothetical protein